MSYLAHLKIKQLPGQLNFEDAILVMSVPNFARLKMTEDKIQNKKYDLLDEFQLFPGNSFDFLGSPTIS